MRMAKRVLLFIATNILIIATLSSIISLLGLEPYLSTKGINYQSLLIFCLFWGFGGAFISLLLSRVMAKWMMGVKIIDPQTRVDEFRTLVQRVHTLSRKAGLEKMPEVGYYESEEINAFATGATKNRSLVAVSTGLLRRMNSSEIEGVLAHEVAHIANGDMVTMTLVQGVVNAFVMFLARVIGFFASQFVPEDKRNIVQFGLVIVLEIAIGILGMVIVAFFSRKREYLADRGGARLSSTDNMIAALERLKLNYAVAKVEEPSALATLKISGRENRFLKLFSTHPDLNDRIQRLKGISNA